MLDSEGVRYAADRPETVDLGVALFKCMFFVFRYIAWCGNLPGKRAHMQLVRKHSASHQLAKPLWTDPDMKSGVIVHELISTY